MLKLEEGKYPLPYYAKMDILLRIIDELKGTKDHKDISTTYRNIKADKTAKIFGLRLGRFLGLIESDTKNAWLTELGYRFSMLQKEQKKTILTENIPSYYITFLKWIKDSKEKILDIDSLKAEILKNFKEWHPSPRVLHESLLTFGDVTEYCGFISFIKGRKGAKSRFQLTDSGLQLLSGINPVEEPSFETKGELQEEKSKLTIQQLPKELIYPIMIQTRENKFNIDITHDSDWDMIGVIIKTLKTKWQESRKSRIKGESAKEA